MGWFHKCTEWLGWATRGLGSESKCWHATDPNLFGGLTAQARMGSSSVVLIDVLGNVLFVLTHRLVRPQIDLLILDRTPDALYEHIVSPSPPTIH